MKKTLKSFAAISLVITVLFSLCSCSVLSNKPDADQESVLSDVISEIITEPKENYKEKIDEIISTLEVGKSYSELPLTPEKVGIKRFSCSEHSRYNPGDLYSASSPSSFYVDMADETDIKIYYDLPHNTPIGSDFWCDLGVDVVENVYIPVGDKFYRINKNTDREYIEPLGDLFDSDGFEELKNITLYNSGYTMNIDAIRPSNAAVDEYIYRGTTQIDGYDEVLFFECPSYSDLYPEVLFYIDPNTSFCVKVDVGNSTTLLIKDIEINPKQQVPDFENNLVDPNTYRSYKDVVNTDY